MSPDDKARRKELRDRVRVVNERCEVLGAQLGKRLGVPENVGQLLLVAAIGITAKRTPVVVEDDDGEQLVLDAQGADALFAMQAFKLGRSALDNFRAARPRKPKALPPKRSKKR